MTPAADAPGDARLRALIFDLDGTLADTIPLCIEAFRRTVAGHGGGRLSDHEIRSMFGPTEEGMLQRALAGPWEEAHRTYLEIYERLHEGVREPFPGLTESLRRVRSAGARLALVTGKGAKSAALSCRVLGLEEVFDPVVTGSHAGPVKARCIRQVIDLWETPGEYVAYVGDGVADVAAAREAGVLAVAAAWAPSADPEALAAARPDALFRSSQVFADWADAVLETGASDAGPATDA